IRAALDGGRNGEPILARIEVLLPRGSSYYTATPWRGTWGTAGGGVLTTQAIHCVDLLQWFVGDVDWVMTAADTFAHGDHIEVEDTLAATLRLSSGAIAQFTASTALTPGLGQRIAITGTTGASVSLFEYPEGAEAVNDVWALPGQAAYSYPTEVLADRPLTEINGSLAPFHAEHITDFVTAVRTGRPPAVTGEDALRSLRTMSAMYRSMHTGRPERPDDSQPLHTERTP